MNFFSIERVNNAIKSGKPIIYHNIEMSSEEAKKHILNTLRKKEKSILDERKLVNIKYIKYESDPNKRSK